MAQSILLEIYTARLGAFREAFIDCYYDGRSHQKHGAASKQSLQDLEAVVIEALKTPVDLRAAWRSVVDLMTEGDVEDPQAIGERLCGTIEEALTLLFLVRETTQKFAASGRQVAGAEELSPAIRQVFALRAEVESSWTYSPLTVRDVLAAEEKGELMELNEAFASIAGVPLEVWNKRVADRRAALGG